MGSYKMIFLVLVAKVGKSTVVNYDCRDILEGIHGSSPALVNYILHQLCWIAENKQKEAGNLPLQRLLLNQGLLLIRYLSGFPYITASMANNIGATGVGFPATEQRYIGPQGLDQLSML